MICKTFFLNGRKFLIHFKTKDFCEISPWLLKFQTKFVQVRLKKVNIPSSIIKPIPCGFANYLDLSLTYFFFLFVTSPPPPKKNIPLILLVFLPN